jgi:Lhr-like helicase
MRCEGCRMGSPRELKLVVQRAGRALGGRHAKRRGCNFSIRRMRIKCASAVDKAQERLHGGDVRIERYPQPKYPFPTTDQGIAGRARDS